MAQRGDSGTGSSATSSTSAVASAVAHSSEGHANEAVPSRTVRVAARHRAATPPPPTSIFQTTASMTAAWKSERYEAAEAHVDKDATTRANKEAARRRAATPPGRAGDNPKMAARCRCGNVFASDSIYCRKCGVRRPSVSELIAEYEKSLQGLHHLDLQLGEHAQPLQCEICGEAAAQKGTVRVFVACLIGVCVMAKMFYERQQMSSGRGSFPHSSASMSLGLVAAFVMHLGAILPGLPSTSCRGALWLVVCKAAMIYVCALAFILYQAYDVRCSGWIYTALGIVRGLLWLPLSVAAARDILHSWNSVTWYQCALGEMAVFAVAATYMELLIATRFGHGQIQDWMGAVAQTLLRSVGGLLTVIAHWYNIKTVAREAPR